VKAKLYICLITALFWSSSILPVAGGAAVVAQTAGNPLPSEPKRLAQTLPQGHPKIDGGAAQPKIDFSRITKPAGGKNIAEIYKEKPQLVGKKVAVRGKVVKFNSGIMGKNWIHLRDGTGSDGTNDLTVTTDGTAKIGDTVLVRGALVADKDFGHGYKYAVIIEDAQITVE
jgi:hypothetical protein